MDDRQCLSWKRREWWTFEETANLLAGIVPKEVATEEQSAEREEAKNALAGASIGVLPSLPYERGPSTLGGVRDGLYRPQEVIRWAADNWPRFPFAQQKMPKPEGVRRDSTLLLIIDALLKNDSIDPEARDSTAKVEQLVQDLGESMHSKTVRAVLKQVKQLRQDRNSR